MALISFKVGRWGICLFNFDCFMKRDRWFWREERFELQWPFRTNELDVCYDAWGFGFFLLIEVDMPPADRYNALMTAERELQTRLQLEADRWL